MKTPTPLSMIRLSIVAMAVGLPLLLLTTDISQYPLGLALYSFLMATLSAITMLLEHDAAKNRNQQIKQINVLTEKYFGKEVNTLNAATLETMLNGLLRSLKNIENADSGEKIGLLYTQLQMLRKEISDRNEKDRAIIWINEGLAKIRNIFQENTTNISEASAKIVSFISRHLNTQVAAMYILNSSDQTLSLKACFAFDKKRVLEQTVPIGSGLIGQCYLEKDIILLKQVPNDYLKITSGLGGAKPQCVVLIPLLYNNEAHGVMEFASFNQLSSDEVEFLRKAAESIAASIFQIKNHEEMQALLTQLQEQAESMQANEEELRQNMEELAATQELMKRQLDEVTLLKSDLEKERYLFDALMNNLPDAIYYKDEASKLIRVSKHMADIFGMRPSELIGKSDFDFQDPDHATKAFEDELTIMRTRKPLVDIEEKETREDGTEVWVSTTKLPLTDAAGLVVGTFGISRNISKIKHLEKDIKDKEQNLRIERYRYEERIGELEQKINRSSMSA